MNLPRILRLALYCTLSIASCYSVAEADDVFWIGGASPSNWNTGSNWELDGGINSVPSIQFNDIAHIGNGNTAFLSSAATNAVGQLDLGGEIAPLSPTFSGGTLEIRTGGQLTVQADQNNSGNVTIGRVPNGGASLGDTLDDAQQGTLEITGNGMLNVGNRFFLERRNNADPFLTLADTANLVVAGDTDIRGTARIVGPNVSFTTNTMQWGGQLRLIPEITQVGGAAAHSTIDVTGIATLNAGSTIAPEFSSAPVGGEVYTLVEAATIVNNGVNIDSSSVPLGAGQRLNLSIDRSGPTDLLNLSVDNVLTLIANRQTGAVSLNNVHGSGIAIKGYSIQSPSGSLNPNDGVWSSFDDRNLNGGTWQEANPTTSALNELNLTSSRTLGGGTNDSLGDVYTVDNSTFGQLAADDLTFTYQTASGETKTGIVQYEGNFNSLVLRVDPATGNAEVTNESSTTVEINGYSVTSGSGSLLTTWNSLDDQGTTNWEEANPTSEALSELNLTGGLTLSNGQTFTLDGLWDTSGNQDLSFNFSLRGASSEGDYNNDGVVNAADYTVWRDNLGQDSSALNGNGTGAATVVQADYALWRQNFGNAALSGAVTGVVLYEAFELGTASGVPEPSTGFLLLVISTCVGFNRRQNHAVA